jgi:hypothetical protein
MVYLMLSGGKFGRSRATGPPSHASNPRKKHQMLLF